MNSLVDIKSFPPNRWVIWVGAGISRPAPTCLPLGKQLTEFALKEVCGSSESKAIFDIWNRVYNLINQKDVYKNFSQIPRLESILDVISEVETKTVNIDYSFMNGFRAFLEAPYNNLHVSLSLLLSLGAIIITSNFDLCIEKAYNKIFDGKDVLVPSKMDTLIVYKSENDNSATGEVWHYHGTVDEIQTMGATLRIVKEGLHPNVKNRLVEVIQKSEVTIFVGYSFSDAFDINPFFESCNEKSFSTTLAVYFQHIPDNHSSKPVSLPKRIAQLLRCFKTYQFDFGKTEEFLSALSGNKEFLTGVFEWQKKFLQYANLYRKDDIKAFLICKISNFLGIGITKLSRTAYRNALKFQSNYPNDDFHDTMAVTLRRQGKFELEKKHHLQKKNLIMEKGERLIS